MREKIGFLLFLFVGEIHKCCYRWWKSLFPRKLSGLPFDTQTTQGDTQIRGMLSSDINVASAPKLVHFLIDFFSYVKFISEGQMPRIERGIIEKYK